MTTTTCSGTLIALGQYQFDLRGTRYAYVEIRRRDGRIVRADDVIVLNGVGSLLHDGVEGDFHFDAARHRTTVVRQLFGLRRSDGRWAYDAEQVRVAAAAQNIVYGAVFSFLCFVGVPFLLMGLLQLVYSIGTARLREEEFFGPGGRAAASARRDAVVRI